MRAALARLVACDTSFPPGATYAAFCDLVESLFAPLDCTSERIEVPAEHWQAPGARGARVNLLLRPHAAAATEADLPEAMIYFHTDTAPVGDGWTRPALELTSEGDRLFGRGTADMKGTIVAAWDAFRRLAAADRPLRYRPVLAFCTDEEGGRYPGIRYLAETGPLAPVLLNLNGSAEPRVWAGCLGSMDLVLELRGAAAHSGRPFKGRNAIELALPAINALHAAKANIEARISDMPAPPADPGPLRGRLTLTALQAGDKGSAVPGRCRVTVNRRYLPEEDSDAVRAEIETIVAEALSELPRTDWSLDEVGHLPPVTDPDGPATDRWTAARACAFGMPEDAFTRYGSGTSSDFGWVQRAGQRHMLLGGLSRPDNNTHGPDEFTTGEDLVALSRAIELFFAADFRPEDGRQQREKGAS